MCPYWRKPCGKVPKCHFRRIGVRFFDDGKKEPIEMCVFDVIADTLENLVARMIGQQGATEGVRNELSKVSSIFEQMANLKKFKALEGK